MGDQVDEKFGRHFYLPKMLSPTNPSNIMHIQ